MHVLSMCLLLFDYTVPGRGASLERCLLSRFYSIIIKAGDTGATRTLVFIEPTCAKCTVGSYALLSVCRSRFQNSLDNNSYL